MPANVVKSKDDETKWEKAKAIAAEQGKSEKWPLIMHIYQNMKENEYNEFISKIVEGILETTATGAIGIVPKELGSPIDGKKVADAAVDPEGDQAVPVTTLAQMYPDVFLPLSKTQKHHAPPKGDQTGGYDTKRPDSIIANQHEQVKSGIISLILRAGQEQAQAEAEAKAQEHAAEIAAKKEEARFELSHGGKVLDQKQKEWALEKEKLLFKAKHKPKSVKETIEDEISKYPTEPWGTKVKKPSWNYDAEKYPDFVKDEKVKKPSWNYDAETYPEFEDVVSNVLSRVDTNLENPTGSPEEKDKTVKTGF